MKTGLYLTEKWTLEELLPYGPDITRCLKKLSDKFPDDSTVKSLAHDIMHGGLSLWLMFEDGNFRGIVLTEMRTVPATGYKTAIVSGSAGEGGVDFAPYIETIEEWAWENGCDAVTPVGRKGWERVLGKAGYTAERVIYSKRRPELK